MHRESGKDCTVAQLGEILAQMCNTAKAGRKVTSVYIFGIQYGETIRRKAYKASDIISASGLNASYETELSKAVNIFDCIAEGTHGLRFADDTGIAEQTTASAATPRTRKMHPLNVILYGAPGTGKTYATAEYALAVIENRPVDVTPKTAEQRKEVMERYNAYLCRKQIVFTTFHQSYGYEDFVQGLRPDIETAPMKLRYVDGVFKSLVERAKNDAEKDYVLIIDEINRANISKVFGELITLLEEDKRMGEANALCATLPSGEAFAVPNNVYIIGTMNSADKSISLLDTALRRRFAFIEVEPDCTLIADETLRKVLERLNRSLVSEFENTDLLIGHAYFIGKSTEELCTIMNQNIIPLLYEYFYDNGEKVKKRWKMRLRVWT